MSPFCILQQLTNVGIICIFDSHQNFQWFLKAAIILQKKKTMAAC